MYGVDAPYSAKEVLRKMIDLKDAGTSSQTYRELTKEELFELNQLLKKSSKTHD